jgi:very-short-patch-repair endonuclease
MPPARNIVVGQTIDEAKVARAKELRREMTLAEAILWDHLRTNRLSGYHFRRQQVIDGFIVDFYCHAAALVVEVDGAVHDRQADYDRERDKIIATHGILFLRFTNDEIMRRLPDVLEKIATACAERNGK